MASTATTLPSAVEDEHFAVPVIDIGVLFETSTVADGNLAHLKEQRERVIQQLRHACREVGFFYCAGHRIEQSLLDALFNESLRFFNMPLPYKNQIHMRNTPHAFRGYFELGGELTSYKADWKEGLYFGEELDDSHPDVLAKKPMHGRNQFPNAGDFPGYDRLVLEYMSRMTELGHIIMEGVASSLGLESDFFRKKFTTHPFTPFRIFHYPSDPAGVDAAGGERWGVGVHRDYGCLTILTSPDITGLEIELKSGVWVKAKQIPGTFVVNIGDMLEVWTKGVVRAAPHRVKNVSSKDRISAPFFFDPNFDCMVSPLDITFSADGKVATAVPASDTDLSALTSNPSIKNLAFPLRYGNYILRKVLNNFPELEEMAAQ